MIELEVAKRVLNEQYILALLEDCMFEEISSESVKVFLSALATRMNEELDADDFKTAIESKMGGEVTVLITRGDMVIRVNPFAVNLGENDNEVV